MGINLNRVVSIDWFLVSCIVTGELAQIGQKKERLVYFADFRVVWVCNLVAQIEGGTQAEGF